MWSKARTLGAAFGAMLCLLGAGTPQITLASRAPYYLAGSAVTNSGRLAALPVGARLLAVSESPVPAATGRNAPALSGAAAASGRTHGDHPDPLAMFVLGSALLAVGTLLRVYWS